MGVRERRDRERELRRRLIVRAGERLFLRKGLEQTTMDEIAEACELGKGTLYLYFRSKEELYLGIVAQALRGLRLLMEKRHAQAAGPDARLRAVGEAYLEYHRRQHDHFQLLAHFGDHRLPEGRPEEGEALREIAAEHERIWDLITRTIREGVATGVFRPEVEPLELALVLWTASNGMIQFIDRLRGQAGRGGHLPQLLPGTAPEDLLRRSWELIMASVTVVGNGGPAAGKAAGKTGDGGRRAARGKR